MLSTWKQNFKIFSYLCVLLMANSCWAIGFGKVSMYSFLNEPLSAEIELLGVENIDPTLLQVNLASPKDFVRANMARPFYLTKLKFDITRYEDKTIVYISTINTITHPFLDFLLELSWPNGRIVKAYTLLLDPPLSASKKQASRSVPMSKRAGIGKKDEFFRGDSAGYKQQSSRQGSNLSNNSSTSNSAGSAYNGNNNSFSAHDPDTAAKTPKIQNNATPESATKINTIRSSKKIKTLSDSTISHYEQLFEDEAVSTKSKVSQLISTANAGAADTDSSDSGMVAAGAQNKFIKVGDRDKQVHDVNANESVKAAGNAGDTSSAATKVAATTQAEATVGHDVAATGQIAMEAVAAATGVASTATVGSATTAAQSSAGIATASQQATSIAPTPGTNNPNKVEVGANSKPANNVSNSNTAQANTAVVNSSAASAAANIAASANNKPAGSLPTNADKGSRADTNQGATQTPVNLIDSSAATGKSSPDAQHTKSKAADNDIADLDASLPLTKDKQDISDLKQTNKNIARKAVKKEKLYIKYGIELLVTLVFVLVIAIYSVKILRRGNSSRLSDTTQDLVSDSDEHDDIAVRPTDNFEVGIRRTPQGGNSASSFADKSLDFAIDMEIADDENSLAAIAKEIESIDVGDDPNMVAEVVRAIEAEEEPIFNAQDGSLSKTQNVKGAKTEQADSLSIPKASTVNNEASVSINSAHNDGMDLKLQGEVVLNASANINANINSNTIKAATPSLSEESKAIDAALDALTKELAAAEGDADTVVHNQEQNTIYDQVNLANAQMNLADEHEDFELDQLAKDTAAAVNYSIDGLSDNAATGIEVDTSQHKVMSNSDSDYALAGMSLAVEPDEIEANSLQQEAQKIAEELSDVLKLVNDGVTDNAKAMSVDTGFDIEEISLSALPVSSNGMDKSSAPVDTGWQSLTSTASMDDQALDAEIIDMDSGMAGIQAASKPLDVEEDKIAATLDTFVVGMGEDELAIKINLAKNYIAAGDTNTAKEILTEIIAANNPTYVTQAQELISQLA